MKTVKGNQSDQQLVLGFIIFSLVEQFKQDVRFLLENCLYLVQMRNTKYIGLPRQYMADYYCKPNTEYSGTRSVCFNDPAWESLWVSGVGWVVWMVWLTPTTYIQLARAGSINSNKVDLP